MSDCSAEWWCSPWLWATSGLAGAGIAECSAWLLLMETAGRNPPEMLQGDPGSALRVWGAFQLLAIPCDTFATNEEFSFHSIAWSRCGLFDPRTIHATNKTSPEGKHALNLQAVFWSVPCSKVSSFCSGVWCAALTVDVGKNFLLHWSWFSSVMGPLLEMTSTV